MSMALFTALLFALVVGVLVELYKKRVRKDKAGKTEIRAIAVIPSVLAGTVLALYLIPGIPFLAGLGLWIKIVGSALASIVFYLVQLFVDMRIIKDLMRQYFWDKTPEFLDTLLENLPEATRPVVKKEIEKIME